MSANSWFVLIAAAASAGVYCGALAASLSGRWIPGRIPLPGLLAAAALFAFARIFASATPPAILAALFALVAIVQIANSKRADTLLKSLSLVPPAAMLIVSLGQIGHAVSPSVLQNTLAAVLCVPAPIALVLSLRNFDLIRKVSLDRIR